MESANTHHHHPQLQDQLAGSSASCYGLPFTTTHVWPPPPLFEIVHPESTAVSSHLNSSMAQEITTYNWANNATTNSATNHHSDQDLQQHSRIKEELARYIEMLSSSPQSSTDQHANDATTKFLLNLMNNNTANARGFAQIFPASLNQMPVTNPVSLEMNLEALDILASTRFCGNQIGTMRDGFFNYGFDHMQQQSLQIPFYDSTKVSSPPSNAVVEAKRNSNKMEAKSHLQNAPKRFRLEARSSCPPLKVRKEKLGDRIAALQQLVAPFGKTDTASVLMEAIGYIKFLQNQVETLSVPYMKASRNKLNRVAKGNHNENETEESKRDLKSRGLCLVPLSCLSYIADGGGAAVWPPPHFGGAT